MFIFPDAGIDPPRFCRSNEDNPLALEVAACPVGVLPHLTPSAAKDCLSTLRTGSGNPGGSQHDRARKSLIPSLVLIFIRLDLLATVDEDCYDRLSLRDLFSTLLLLPSYVPVRTMSIPGGPVRILPWSPDFLSRALSSGRPYPCSSPTLHLLNGVGSLFSSHRYSHCLFVIPTDSIISSR